MLSLSPQQTLSLWEQGVRRHPIDRALLLFAVARPDLHAESLADRPLGERNAALMQLQCESFKARLPAWVECPNCQERMEFELDPAQLPAPAQFEQQDAPVAEVAGYSFRLPTSRHLSTLVQQQQDQQAAAAHATDDDTAARTLLQNCLENEALLPDDEAALAELLQEVESALEEADPWAHLALTVQCPVCGCEDVADFDVAQYLWHEIESHSQRLLNDIHHLAQAYGWNESQILALSAARRAAYLQRISYSTTDRDIGGLA